MFAKINTRVASRVWAQMNDQLCSVMPNQKFQLTGRHFYKHKIYIKTNNCLLVTKVQGSHMESHENRDHKLCKPTGKV